MAKVVVRWDKKKIRSCLLVRTLHCTVTIHTYARHRRINKLACLIQSCYRLSRMALLFLRGRYMILNWIKQKYNRILFFFFSVALSFCLFVDRNEIETRNKTNERKKIMFLHKVHLCACESVLVCTLFVYYKRIYRV